MAKFSSLIIASHQSAMNFSSLMYAFPMSISSAMAIVVSYEVGAKRFDDAKTYIGLGRWTASFCGLHLIFPLHFQGKCGQSLWERTQNFIDLTARFLTYSLFFQLADTFAAPLQGILRGYKDYSYSFLPWFGWLLGGDTPSSYGIRLSNRFWSLFLLDWFDYQSNREWGSLPLASNCDYEEI